MCNVIVDAAAAAAATAAAAAAATAAASVTGKVKPMFRLRRLKSQASQKR